MTVLDHSDRLRRAADAIASLKAKVARLESARAEPIAIIGMGCRLPGGIEDLGAFWDLLAEGREAIGEVPKDRWDIDRFYHPDPDAAGKIYTRAGHFLDRIDAFDPQFFGISPREAANLDPQQRLLLEVAWEALENAGIAPDSLYNSQTGVAVGISCFDFALRRLASSSAYGAIDAYLSSGTSLSVAAGRVSYTLGLQGPCFSVDTLCSASLVGVHLACQALRGAECDLALAGGVNVLTSPAASINFCRARMLSPDGRCKTFSDQADGYGRGEGCGVVVLKRLSDALAHGDPIWALIRGSALNHDGPSGGLTVPNGPAQQAVIRSALAAGGVSPSEVDYVECHGTGTPLGDPIEAGALGAVYGQDRDRPLRVGSVKTNIGHLEAAAGIAGLIKTALALKHEILPAHLHFKTPNSRVKWDELGLEVTAKAQSWPRGTRPRLAGVSAFGMSGTNAHLVLEEPPVRAVGVDPRPVQVFTLSARSPAALAALADRMAQAVRGQDLASVCRTVNAGRTVFAHRLAIVATDTGVLARDLAAFAAGDAGGALTGFAAQSHSVARSGIDPDVTAIGTDWFARAHSASASFVAGAALDWDAQPAPKIALPGTVFERQTFPLDPPDDDAPDALGARFGVRVGAPWLAQHRVFGRTIAPLAAVTEALLIAGRRLYRSGPLTLSDISLTGAVPVAGALTFEVAAEPVEPAGFALALYQSGQTQPVATARVTEARGSLDPTNVLVAGESVDTDAYYDRFATFGISYGPALRTLTALGGGAGCAVADIRLPDMVTDTGICGLHPLLLDGAVQAVGAALPPEWPRHLVLPVAASRLMVRGSLDRAARAQVVLAPHSTPERIVADIVLVATEGQALLEGLTLVSTGAEAEVPLGGAVADGLSALRAIAARVLRLDPDSLDVTAPLTGMGLDSLLALELRNSARSDAGIEVALAALLGGASVAELAATRADHAGQDLVEDEL